MFYSIVYPSPETQPPRSREPQCFRDLNLDRLLGPIWEKEPGLEALFYTPVQDPGTVRYRQQVLADLEKAGLSGPLDRFSRQISGLEQQRQQLVTLLDSGKSWENHYYNRGKLLYCAGQYVQALDELGRCALQPEAPGLNDFLHYAAAYRESEAYRSFCRELQQVQKAFRSLRYCLLIRYGTVRVKKFEGEGDLSERVCRIFQKFRQEEAGQPLPELPDRPCSDQVEASILGCLSRIYPEQFRLLDDFLDRHRKFTDPVILRFCREVRFYFGWLRRIRPMRQAGLPFCLPKIGEGTDCVYGFFDPMLALQLGKQTVCNDFYLEPPERIIVVTGPNQGGKTTFARALGQLYYLAGLGLSIPGSRGSLHLKSSILTHFERQENLENLSGKLRDDLVRLKALLAQAGPDSFVVVNEIFASTTLSDALQLGKQMMDALETRGAGGVIVTFMDELACRGPETVSMMSTVDPEDPAIRTYQVVRKPPDGLAYALTLANRRGLTYEQLVRRLQQ